MSVFKIFATPERFATLCESCVFAHVVEGESKRLVSCNFGYTLRAIEFGVTNCTGYFDRSKANSTTVIRGFANHSSDRERAS